MEIRIGDEGENSRNQDSLDLKPTRSYILVVITSVLKKLVFFMSLFFKDINTVFFSTFSHRIILFRPRLSPSKFPLFVLLLSFEMYLSVVARREPK